MISDLPIQFLHEPESLPLQKKSLRLMIVASLAILACFIGNRVRDGFAKTHSVHLHPSDSVRVLESASVPVRPNAFVFVSFDDSKNEGARNVELNAKRAFSYLEKICAIGSRTSGTPGMKKQQEMLQEHFEKHGGTVLWQPFDMRHPETGNRVDINNMVVQWRPELTQRVMLCTHYDTKPFPANDAKNPRGLFVGANDGGSGTALFMELAHVMNDLPTKVGVDFVFFDAEELVYDENRDQFFIGSTYFAQAYANNPNGTRYRCAILLDMIGDIDLQLQIEKNSFDFARALVEDVWGVAKKLKVKEFENRMQGPIRDDHLPLNEIAKIPAIDIIDFDYSRGARSRSFWHTTADTPDKCSGASLVKVGKVLVEWIKQQP
ncbi:MAG: M28 family peptidase [Pirellula sp.]